MTFKQPPPVLGSRFLPRLASLLVLTLALILGVTSFAAGPPTVQIVVPAAPIQAGGGPVSFQINVANDLPGDMPTLTTFVLNGIPCTPAVCGSFGAVTGTSGSGSYLMTYTPPSIAPAVSLGIVVTPSLAGQSFPGTISFVVYPAGMVVQVTGITGGLNIVPVGSAVRTITYTVYNDVGNAGLTFTMTGSGYACQNLSQNSCGTLGTPQVSTSGTTTTTVVTYKPPTSLPDEPYDRVRIQATSVADPTNFITQNFLLSPGPGPSPIGYGQKFDSVLTGGAAGTLLANFSDPTATKSANWTLTANGAPCPAPACGTLTNPAVSTNGDIVTSGIIYTPPTSVPAGDGQNFPTITVTSTANPNIRDSFSFHIVDGSCSTGNEAALNGQYAFLLKGAGATAGYNATVGSFVADGNGNITSGLQDVNRSIAVVTGLTLKGSYSVGSDNRGCLRLTNSNGGTLMFRIALGSFSSGTAAQGAMTAFVDNNGQGLRLTGLLKQQDLTSPTFNGTYAFGWEGMDSSGYRVAAAGLISSDGAGNLTNTSFDVNDNGNLVTLTGAAGSYNLASGAPGGRGTLQIVIPVGGGSVTANEVLYVVSASDAFFMSIDPTDTSHPILIGEAKLQTGPFSTSVLASGSGYVFWTSGIDSSNGASITTLGQAQFTTNTGVATVTADSNDYGVEGPEGSAQATFTIDSSGRMTITGLGPNAPIVYMVDSTQGFAVGGSGTVASGYVQQQTLSSFSTSTISGQFFFGGGAPATEGSYESGSLNFAPGEPSGTIAIAFDSSRPDRNLFCDQCNGGLQPNNSFKGFPYTFSAGASAPGQGCLGDVVAGPACQGNLIGYIISPSKMVFMQTSTPDNTSGAEIFVLQQ
jgi:hypothetical protein